MTLGRQLPRFLVVGSLTVLLDLCTYQFLLWQGVLLDLSKAVGFLAGCLFAYFANRLFTFQARGGAPVFARFWIVYLTNMGLHVGVNAFVVRALFTYDHAIAIGFLVATGVSALGNFFGLKLFVFADSDGSARKFS